MSDLVARAAEMAERAGLYARERMAELQTGNAQGIPFEVRALMERELSSAFIVGWAARDEQSGAGRLPGPRRKR